MPLVPDFFTDTEERVNTRRNEVSPQLPLEKDTPGAI